jgi:hypothetical protein
LRLLKEKSGESVTKALSLLLLGGKAKTAAWRGGKIFGGKFFGGKKAIFRRPWRSTKDRGNKRPWVQCYHFGTIFSVENCLNFESQNRYFA